MREDPMLPLGTVENLSVDGYGERAAVLDKCVSIAIQDAAALRLGVHESDAVVLR
jgi:hypothetical protein